MQKTFFWRDPGKRSDLSESLLRGPSCPLSKRSLISTNSRTVLCSYEELWTSESELQTLNIISAARLLLHSSHYPAHHYQLNYQRCWFDGVRRIAQPKSLHPKRHWSMVNSAWFSPLSLRLAKESLLEEFLFSKNYQMLKAQKDLDDL